MSSRGTYVFREGKCIPKHLAAQADHAQIAHSVSDLPRPYIHGALKEYQSMVTGEMITDRRQHREHLKQHGVVEVGNDAPVRAKAPIHAKGEIAGDIKKAMEQVRAGYIPPEGPIGKKDEEGNVIEAPNVEPVEIRGVPENGAIIRAGSATPATESPYRPGMKAKLQPYE